MSFDTKFDVFSFGEKGGSSHRRLRGLQYAPYPGPRPGTDTEETTFDEETDGPETYLWYYIFYGVLGIGFFSCIWQIWGFYKAGQRLRREEEEAEQERIRQEQNRRDDLLGTLRKQNRCMTVESTHLNLLDQIPAGALTEGQSEDAIAETSKQQENSQNSNEPDDISIENDNIEEGPVLQISPDGSDKLTTSSSCAICLDRYKVGDQVVWSSNIKRCPHIFHEKCCLEYLIKVIDEDGSAPCCFCRQEFLKDEDDLRHEDQNGESRTEGV